MPRFTWEEMRKKPDGGAAELDALIRFVQGAQKLCIEDKEKTYPTTVKPNHRFTTLAAELTELKQNMAAPDGAERFARCMKGLGGALSVFKQGKVIQLHGKELYGQMERMEDFGDIVDSVKLPEPGTAEFFSATSYMGQASIAQLGNISDHAKISVISNYLALYELTKGKRDWEKTPIDTDKLIFERAPDINREAQHLPVPQISTPQFLSMLERAENGAPLDRQLYEPYLQTTRERLADSYNSLARSGGLKVLPEIPTDQELGEDERKELRDERKEKLEKNIEKLSEILTCRALDRVQPRSGGSTVETIGRMLKLRAGYEALLPDFITSMPLDKLNRTVMKDRNGKALESAFRKHILGVDKLPDNLDESLRPTAKERIEALQKKLKQESAPEETRRRLAQIIAAREAVGAKRGGKGLDGVIPDVRRLNERARVIEENLKEMDYVDIAKLRAAAQDGHGGDMMEKYQERNTYAARQKTMKTLAALKNVPPERVAKALALNQHIMNSGADKQADMLSVNKTAEALRRMDGFDAFASDPKTQKLIYEGDPGKLVESFVDHVNAAERAKQPKQQPAPQKQVEQPEANLAPMA